MCVSGGFVGGGCSGCDGDSGVCRAAAFVAVGGGNGVCVCVAATAEGATRGDPGVGVAVVVRIFRVVGAWLLFVVALYLCAPCVSLSWAVAVFRGISPTRTNTTPTIRIILFGVHGPSIICPVVDQPKVTHNAL